MPKLLLFAGCEKVIINEADNTTSLITLLETINLPVPLGSEDQVPKDANAALSWHMIALWQAASPQEYEKQYEQRFAVVLPTGRETKMSAVMPFRVSEEKPNFRSVVNILGFPLADLIEAGDRILLKLFLREQGDDAIDWVEIAEFPIMVRRLA